MSTDRLYYRDCYLSAFDARVIDSSDGGRRVYLDRTAFYPTSGGQPNDLGTLGEQPVLDVIDEEDRIAHVLAAPLRAGIVRGEVDWASRYDHMQQHTGQHLLSAVLVELFGYQTLSFHLGAETSTIELDSKELTDSQIDEAEERTNQLVREARPVEIRFEDAEAVQALRKPSARAGILRIIEIQDLDRSACGGTHVRSTAELAPIQIRRSEKLRGHVRIEFVCGRRAVRRAKQDFRLLAELSRHAAVSFERLPEHVTGLRQRLHEAEKERQKTATELARREGEALHDATQPGAGGLRRLLLRVPAIDEAARGKAQAFAGRGRAVALVLADDPAGVLIATSPDSAIHAGAVLKQALSIAGGRGGGSATLAQAGMPAAAVEKSLLATLGFAPSASDSDSKQDQTAGEQSGRQADR